MLTETQCKRLTEFLGEKLCADDSRFIVPCVDTAENCLHIKLGGTYSDCKNKISRTFTTRDDMMDLYQRLWNTGKWDRFIAFTYMHHQGFISYFTAWLFCLSGDDYEKRCRMVDGFLEGGK